MAQSVRSGQANQERGAKPVGAAAVKIAAAFGLVGGLWVLLFNAILDHYFPDHASKVIWNDVAGCVFVLAASLLLGSVLKRYFRQLESSNRAVAVGEDRWRDAIEGAGQGVWDWNIGTGEVFISSRLGELLEVGTGVSTCEIADLRRHVHPDDLERLQESIRGRLERDSSECSNEYRVVRGNGATRWVLEQGRVMGRLPDGSPSRFLALCSDITERKSAERLSSLSGEVLGILNDRQTLATATQRILDAIKRETGFEAVGIRLQRGDDFPYSAAVGFSPAFIRAENSLVSRSVEGEFCRDERGALQLECTCGMVISGQTDPSNPLFTSGGSAWTNDAQAAGEDLSAGDPRLNPRDRCLHEGYRSVALIPIRSDGKAIGLLQLNDRRPGCFTMEKIRFFEGLASSFGVALLRLRELQAVREGEERVRLLGDNLPNSYVYQFTHGSDGTPRFTYVSAGVERVHGLTAAEVVRDASCLLSRMDSAAIPAYFAAEAESARSMTDFEMEMHATGLGGDLRVIQIHSRPSRTVDGKVQWDGIVVDVTDRRRSDAHLRQWADAFEHCAHGIAMGVPGKESVLVCNPALARMLGRSVQEIVGSRIPDLYAPDDKGHVIASIAAADRDGQVRYEARMIRSDGTFVPVQMDVVSVRDSGGRILYRIATAQDISDRRRAEEALRQRMELQSQVERIAATVPGLIATLRLKPDGSISMP
jgi:PAS domain S-box-containing protein